MRNRDREFAKQTSHLPDTMGEAIAFLHDQIIRHDAAMRNRDFEAALAIREQARLLARKLNDGKPGILANDDAPGCVLELRCQFTQSPIRTDMALATTT